MEKVQKLANKNLTDRFCGRLIIWDADINPTCFVMLAVDYCRAKKSIPGADANSGLPEEFGKIFVEMEGIHPDSFLSLKPIARRFFERYGYLPDYIFKKPVLN